MRKTRKNPAAFIAALPAGSRAAVSELDRLIRGIMKGRSPALWEGKFWGGSAQSIIGYGGLATTLSTGKKVEWFMVGLAAQKNYVSLYVNAVRGGRYVAEEYARGWERRRSGRPASASSASRTWTSRP